MTILKRELKASLPTLAIWSAALCFMLGICIIIYPEMSKQMGEISQMFADMGAFSSAFGMDSLNFGEFMGYFGIECGNTLGIGGAIFAAILGSSALAKEERDGTAEFLLTHPVSRTRVLIEKLLSCLAQIVFLNLAVVLTTFVCTLVIDVEADAGTLALLFLSHLIMQIEIMSITFGISAFMRRGELGLGLGLVFGFYFMNILANLTEDLKFLKYATPYAYAEGSYIIPEKALDLKYLAVGLALTALGIAAAFLKYRKKDIA